MRYNIISYMSKNLTNLVYQQKNISSQSCHPCLEPCFQVLEKIKQINVKEFGKVLRTLNFPKYRTDSFTSSLNDVK